MKIAFNRMELAGALGDLGTLLPLAIGMIVINGVSPLGLFFTVGLFYIVSALYFGLTVPVQPMKVIGAYAVATGVAYSQITASAFWIFVFLLIIGASGAITLIGRYTPRSVVRGVQLSTGVLLMVEGIKFIVGDRQIPGSATGRRTASHYPVHRPDTDRSDHWPGRRGRHTAFPG